MTLDAELSQSQYERLQEVLAAYLRDIDAGRNPDQAEILARHPEMAEELQEFFAGYKQLDRLAAPLRQAIEPIPDVGMPGTLGDFRIVREVGRGGMGIVYEAEQISLRRRVALKVLPFAATMDPRHLQRFHNEAQAAACLHHTNIVPVFFVGCERGVHFYAMQFIDGQPLSEVIRQMQRLEKKAQPKKGEKTVAYQPCAEEDASTPLAAAELTSLTGEGPRGRDYYRKAAELGIQAAEALDHAHQLGIVHRDIKPGNLLLDGMGRSWVTDFGLAHMQHSEASLTQTGQALGTPRYMSPEQALAKRVPIDHRTDVYSLGVTLYELLTLRPAFASEDRQELLRQIAFEEPARPRRLDRAIPAEFETIVLKAMEKRPQDRYATSQELADDLRRWLLDQPIRARRPSPVQVVRKWVRRNQAAVWAASLVLFVLMIVGVVNALWWSQQQVAAAKKQLEEAEKQRTAETETQTAFDEAVRWQQNQRWPEALSAIRCAQAVLRGFEANATLHQQIDELGQDLEMVQRLEEVPLKATADKDGHFNFEAVMTAYAAAFAEYGLDVEHGDASAAAAFIRSRSIYVPLVAALDNWANLDRLRKGQGWKRLLALARAVDTDTWRNRLRDARERGDSKAMDDLLASAEVEQLLPATLLLFFPFDSVNKDVSIKRTEALLRQVQQRYPADFWINLSLAQFLIYDTQPPQLEEAIGYHRAAVALRPQSPGIHVNLGVALHLKGKLDEAIAEYHAALRLKKDDQGAHNNLGYVLADKGQLDEAIAEFREAIRIDRDDADAHSNLCFALYRKGQLNEAIAEGREAIRLKKESASAHNNLGIALMENGHLDDAITEYREAIRLKTDYAEAHHNLGHALHKKGLLDEAITEYREALRIKKDYAEVYSVLGLALKDKGRLDEAIAACREAIRLNKDLPEAHCNLGNALFDKGLLDEAIAEYRAALRSKKFFLEAYNAHNGLANALAVTGRLDEAMAEVHKALRLKKDFPEAHSSLGNILKAKGRLDEAIAAYREAIRIKKDDAGAHCNLGNALKDKGRLEEAIAAYREAIRINKNIPAAYCNLGDALRQRGLFRQAAEAMRRGHELGSKKPYWPYPSAQWVQNYQRLADLDGKLPAILSGQKQPADTAERLALAQFCQLPSKQLNLAAARFYSAAFVDQPELADDLNAQHRYNAACAAALAGCGQGKDVDKLDVKERARLRQQALDWLRADLKAYRQLMEKSADKAGPVIAQRMQQWLKDNDFARVRGDKALAKLPEAERAAWRKLWADVAELLAKAQGKAPAEKKPDTK